MHSLSVKFPSIYSSSITRKQPGASLSTPRDGSSPSRGLWQAELLSVSFHPPAVRGLPQTGSSCWAAFPCLAPTPGAGSAGTVAPKTSAEQRGTHCPLHSAALGSLPLPHPSLGQRISASIPRSSLGLFPSAALRMQGRSNALSELHIKDTAAPREAPGPLSTSSLRSGREILQ